MVNLQCPDCHKHFKVPAIENVGSMPESCTLACPNEDCGSLLMWEDKKLYNFHRHLNSKNPHWPKDGQDTFSFAI